MLEIWLPLLSLMAIAATWHHVFRLRERATLHARRICEQHGLQFLDDSVALHRLRARWQDRGLHITREYRFDTSLGGHDRRTAGITLVRDRVVGASLPSREPPPAATPAATTPFMARTLPASEGPGTSNVVSFDRPRRRTH